MGHQVFSLLFSFARACARIAPKTRDCPSASCSRSSSSTHASLTNCERNEGGLWSNAMLRQKPVLDCGFCQQRENR
jgi:hypothetical protein